MPTTEDLLQTTALIVKLNELVTAAKAAGIGPDRFLAAVLICAGSSADAAAAAMGNYPFDTLFHEEEWKRMLAGVRSLNALLAPYMEPAK